MTMTIETVKPETVVPETVKPDTIEAEGQDFPLFLNAHEAVELSRCESVVEKGLAAFLDVGQALWQIRQSRLYRESYDTFEAYVEQRWHMSKSSAYRAISATEIVQQLEVAGSPIGDDGQHLLPANEAQARPLSQLPEHQRAEAWAAAVEKSGGQPTAAIVQEVVTDMLPPKPEKADAVVAPLFDVEEDAGERSRFVPPAPAPLNANPLTGQGDMSDEEWEASAKPLTSATEPLSATDALAALNQERDEAVAGWTGDAPKAEDQPAVTTTLEAESLDTADKAAAAIDPGQVDPGQVAPVEAAPVEAAPAAKAPAASPAPKPSAPAEKPAPAAPTLPAGFTTAIVKEEDFKSAMERGLWPLQAVLETVTELEEQVKALEAGELSKSLVEASPSAQLPPSPAQVPPSPAMVVAGVSASRLAEINATSGTILHYSETQLLDELFPERETTGPDHIVAVLVTARLREMTVKQAEEDN